MTLTSDQAGQAKGAVRASLVLGALGIVFGDIGTSPLYALRECLAALPPAERADGIVGALSLLLWTLLLVVNGKYISVVTRVDNQGEGGGFALLALGARRRLQRTGSLAAVVLVGVALLFGEAIITPAISVLGAVEGLSTLDPGLHAWVPAVAIVILAGLFLLQSRGTATLGRWFGPVMLLWFAVLGGLGIWHIADEPGVLRALSPLPGLQLLIAHPADIAPLLGAVVLVITGAEALFADLGHFGRRNITRAWYCAALPGLVLNYFGQGAWALAHPVEDTNPFFALAPAGAPRLALTILAVLAAVIASQAMISGTFSLARQAVQLGYIPRLQIRHTSAERQGQIYLPLVNWALAAGAIGAVLVFRSSSALAGAYGIAVTGAMLMTTLAFHTVARRHLRWPALAAGVVCAVFLLIDVPLFSVTLPKIIHGGWLPLVIAAILLFVMRTWSRGKAEIFRRVYADPVTEEELLGIARSPHLTRVRGAAVFMAGNSTGAPPVLLHHLRANKVLHDHVVLLTILTGDVPVVGETERLELRELGEGIWRGVGRFGYMETPDVNALLDQIKAAGVPLEPAEAVIFFNREIVLPGGNSRMWGWQREMYSWMSHNARSARAYYRVQPAQIIEIGLPVLL